MDNAITVALDILAGLVILWIIGSLGFHLLVSKPSDNCPGIDPINTPDQCRKREIEQARRAERHQRQQRKLRPDGQKHEELRQSFGKFGDRRNE